MKVGVDYIGVSAGAVIVNDAGKFFLAKRSKRARDDQGKWEFPGGMVEFYEPRDSAVVRIIQEKHGLEVDVSEVLGVYDVIDRDHGDHWVSTTYICKYLNGRPAIRQPEKCDEIGWFDYEQLEHLDLSRITKLNLVDLAKKEWIKSKV